MVHLDVVDFIRIAYGKTRIFIMLNCTMNRCDFNKLFFGTRQNQIHCLSVQEQIFYLRACFVFMLIIL
jgi:hypothetical protein